MSETVAREELWIALAEILGPRSVSFRPLIEHFGTPEAIFAAGREELAAVAPELSAGAVSSILRGAGKTNAAGGTLLPRQFSGRRNGFCRRRGRHQTYG